MNVKFALLALVMVGGTAWGRPLAEREVVRADGPWEMAQAVRPEKWMKATVPGTVLGTLVWKARRF